MFDHLGAWIIFASVLAMCVLVPLAHWLDRNPTRAGFTRSERKLIAEMGPADPDCLNDPQCALVLGYQWCTCYSPAVTAIREARHLDLELWLETGGAS